MSARRARSRAGSRRRTRAGAVQLDGELLECGEAAVAVSDGVDREDHARAAVARAVREVLFALEAGGCKYIEREE